MKLKAELAKDIVCFIPNPNKPFIVRTDACAEGIWALLLQEEEGQRRIVECENKKFDKCQKIYAVIEQEAFCCDICDRQMGAFPKMDQLHIRDRPSSASLATNKEIL